jgi:hypothetical protein
MASHSPGILTTANSRFESHILMWPGGSMTRNVVLSMVCR